MRHDPAQMALDLFPCETMKHDALGGFLAWAHGIWKCPPDIDGIAERLFDEMPEAFERGKALVSVTSNGRFDPEVVDALGLFDKSLGYHVCWDRAWAHNCGIDRDLIGRVMRCEYRTRPRFYDADGNLLATLVGAHVGEDDLKRLDEMREYWVRQAQRNKRDTTRRD